MQICLILTELAAKAGTTKLLPNKSTPNKVASGDPAPMIREIFMSLSYDLTSFDRVSIFGVAASCLFLLIGYRRAHLCISHDYGSLTENTPLQFLLVLARLSLGNCEIRRRSLSILSAINTLAANKI